MFSMSLRYIQNDFCSISRERSYNTRIFATVLAISHIHFKDNLQPLLLELGSSLKPTRSYKLVIIHGLHHLKKRAYRRNISYPEIINTQQYSVTKLTDRKTKRIIREIEEIPSTKDIALSQNVSASMIRHMRCRAGSYTTYTCKTRKTIIIHVRKNACKYKFVPCPKPYENTSILGI